MLQICRGISQVGTQKFQSDFAMSHDASLCQIVCRRKLCNIYICELRNGLFAIQLVCPVPNVSLAIRLFLRSQFRMSCH
jgi:hypothetical protein